MDIKYPPELHPSFINKGGKKEGVILPISDYENLLEYLEEVEDILDYEKRKNEDEITIEEAFKDV